MSRPTAAGGLAALFFTSVALAATDLAAPEGRAKALGRQSVMTYSGLTIGPVIADVLLDYGWTWVWVVPALLHFTTTVVASGLSEPRSASAPSAATFGFDRRVIRPAVAILVANFSFATLVAFLPEYSERMHIVHPGWLFSTYAIAVLMVRALTGSFADRVGPARFTVPTLTIGTFGLAALALAKSPWQSFVAIAVVGASLGSTFPAATAASLQRVGGEDRGKAMGTALALGDIGQATAGPLVGFVTTSIAFRWVFGIPALVSLVGVSLIATMPEVSGRH